MISLILATLLGCGAGIPALRCWQQWEAPAFLETARWFYGWALKGLGLPLAGWLLLNLGCLPGLPPLLPGLGQGPAWLGKIGHALGVAGLLVVSYWAAVTYGWLAVSVLVATRRTRHSLVVPVMWGTLLAIPAGLVVTTFGWPGVGAAAALWLGPITYALVDERRHQPPLPSYARALSRMNFRKFNEAEWEIIRELEKCADDFTGWMLLAELNALHYHDLAAAEQTILDLCVQPNLPPSQIGVALNRLADWHLELGNDPVAARRTLEALCAQFPETHMGHMARQRLEQLPATREQLFAQRERKPIRLPPRRTDADP